MRRLRWDHARGRVDRGDAPIDRPVLDVVGELALVGVGTAGLPLVLHQYDPEWFWGLGYSSRSSRRSSARLPMHEFRKG